MSVDQQPSTFVSERHQNPANLMNAQPKHENFTWAAVLACIATVLFIALIAMQWVDLQALTVA